MFEILMICTGNICRSPMAEGLLRHLLPPPLESQVRVSSAGTYAMHGNQPAPHAVTTMARLGIDISAHRARMVSRELLRRTDLSLVMERGHLNTLRTMLLFGKSNIKMLTAFAPGENEPDVADPYGGPLEMYEQSLIAIRPAVEGVIDWLLKRLEPEPAGKMAPTMRQTIRQQMIQALRRQEMDLGQLADRVALTEKEALSHLPHIQKTTAAKGSRLRIRSAHCDGCGYAFTSRKRISPPGRCPKCKQSRISGPWYSVAED